MTKVLGALFSLTLVFSSLAHAEVEWYVCENGDVSVVGDNYFKVELFEDGLTLFPYESGGIAFDAGDLVYSSDTAFIINKKVSYSSEGTQIDAILDGSVHFNYDANDEVVSVDVTIGFDKGVQSQYKGLACKPGTL